MFFSYKKHEATRADKSMDGLNSLYPRWYSIVRLGTASTFFLLFENLTFPSEFFQGHLDWHGNPAWFSTVQDEATFQTYISQKWYEISISFFHIMKIWYFKFHLALVSCQYLCLFICWIVAVVSNKVSQKLSLPLSKIGQFSAFLRFQKIA